MEHWQEMWGEGVKAHSLGYHRVAKSLKKCKIIADIPKSSEVLSIACLFAFCILGRGDDHCKEGVGGPGTEIFLLSCDDSWS